MKRKLFVAAAVTALLGAATAAYAADAAIRITTDKKSYANAQDLSMMNLTIVNHSHEAIYLSDLSFEQVQLRKKFSWVPLENPLRGIRPYIALRLKPNESHEYPVRHFFLPDREDCRGRRLYRIAAQVYSGCQGQGVDQYPDSCAGGRVVYSNAFTVDKDK